MRSLLLVSFCVALLSPVLGWADGAASGAPPPPPSMMPPGGHPHGPPPESLAACQGKAPGTTCSFTGHRGMSLTGKCVPVHNGLTACRPDNMPPHPPGAGAPPPTTPPAGH